ncbi:hypothetical protein B566_EDAN009842 [Ephemera danica]|nr:hypothetical protein B566_EDAN009842 [Ephemera danica]
MQVQNLNHNNLLHFHNRSLDNLSSLKQLLLNRNQLTKFPKELFKNLKKLQLLDLNRNKLTVIEGLSFNGLESLNTLKLKHNSISELADGAFYELKNMANLHLDYNNISSLTKGWLFGLSSLHNLSLSNNNVETIEPAGWEFCSKLVELDMSNNKLPSIEKGTFERLKKLKRLYLNNNLISNIAEGAFDSTPLLEVLELNGNEISWTIEYMSGAFMSLGSLSKLGLASNLINSINKKAFVGLEMLQHLDLNNNMITSVQENAFIGMKQLSKLDMNSSSLLCDCNLKWFPEWLQRSGYTEYVVARCAHPPRLKGRLLSEIDADNFTCNDFPKPRIIEEPDKTLKALKGDNVTLVCRATSSSNSTMTFRWKKDNVDLKSYGIQNYARADNNLSEQRSELQLFNISYNEAGRYQCVVSNEFGITYSQKSKISVLIYPTFTKSPGNLTLKSGSTAKLECAAEGEPKPQIAWQKDGGNDFPAARERRMHVIPSDVIFFIVNVKPSDMGLYSCTAENEAGKIVSNASLTVLETPTFVKPMENKEITAGESTVLECVAAGSPKPKLTWTKDGSPLIATPRHFFTAENQLLIIVNTALSDAGNYQCEMSNTLGTERGSSRLTILPLSVGGATSESITGYIIISVVCCAVLTSICWVIIIYQTRKRHSSNRSSTPEFGMSLDEQEEVEDDIMVMALRPQESTGHFYVDTKSEHSSGKDSGTGDSAKRSSDDLILPEEHQFPLLENGISDVSLTPQCSNGKSEDSEIATLHTFHPHPTNHERCHLVEQDAVPATKEDLNDELSPCIPYSRDSDNTQ